jgi:arsenate reductase
MAEGLLRAAADDLIDVRSAGSKPAGFVQPRAIQVLQEIGIDISRHRSKPVSEFFDQKIATIITVCGDADDACPMFPGKATRHHWGFTDPTHMKGSDEEVLREFRRVRDEMKRVFDAYAAGLRDGKDILIERQN